MDSLKRLSGYQFTDTIARSGHKLIRRAMREEDGKRVVVKQLAQAYPSILSRRSLEFEYRILSRLDHPGIIKAVGHHNEPGQHALILEDFGADNVVRTPNNCFAVGDFLDFAVQGVAALGQLHAQGLIHRDLKPHNIVMNRSTKVVKLIDFQLATELSREQQDIRIANQWAGSLPYLSPEQSGRMNRDLDYRSDYYSLGVTFFQMLTGTLPFVASDVMGWVHAHISQAPPLCHERNQKIPPALSQLVARLMAKEPDQRYQSARALLAHLEQCRGHWNRTGKLPALTIDARDFPETFEVSRDLVGRDKEVKTLLEAFEKARKGDAHMLVVAGYSGVGKSSLVRELLRPVVSSNGRFVSGKFDQLKRDIPYGALIEVMRELTRRLLTEPEDTLQQWRQELLVALGDNISLVCALVPELTRVVDSHPEAAQANPAEAKNRLLRAIAQFLSVFARPDQPVVMFLDDLQWCDASTPEFLAKLLVSHELKHLLVVCAYRDNEVQQGHLFTVAMKRIYDQRPDALSEIALRPLTEEGITTLVSRSLHQSIEASRDLGHLVFDKTSGNPFYASEVLGNLYRTGAIALDEQAGGWKCDLENAKGAPLGNNVVELLLLRLKALPEPARLVLSMAACMGSRFQVQLLAQLQQRSLGATLRSLSDSAIAQLVAPLNDNYRLLAFETQSPEPNPSASDSPPELDTAFRFQHDRVQQAAYALLRPDERLRIHLQLGRLYRAHLDSEQLEARLFEVANHLNLGRSIVEAEQEKHEIHKLNVRAGEKAKRSSAFRIAAHYLDIALEIALEISNQTPEVAPSECRFSLRLEHAECLLMAGEASTVQNLCLKLLKSTSDILERASVHLLLVRVYESQAQPEQAVQEVRTGLGLLGVKLPEEQQKIDQGIGAGIEAMQKYLGATPVEHLLDLPEMTIPAHILTLKLLFQGIPSTFQTNPALFILAELIMFELTVQHGLIPASAKNFVDCGIIQGAILGDYPTAYRLGQTAFGVLERFNARSTAASVNFVFAAFVSSWRAPCDEAMAAFEEAYRSGMESGDIQHVGFSLALRLHRLLHMGHELLDTQDQLDSGIRFLKKHQLSGSRATLVLVERALSRLCDGPVNPETLEREEELTKSQILATRNPQGIYSFGESQLMVSVLLDDYESAERWRDWTAPHFPAALGLISVPEFHVCEALIATRHQWPSVIPTEKENLLTSVRELRDKLKIWADNCPENFSHKYHLVAAELARIEQAELATILNHYRQAEAATGDHFMQMRALALELQAHFWREQGNTSFYKLLLGQASALYAQWGARSKVSQLEKLIPQQVLLQSSPISSEHAIGRVPTSISRTRVGALDLASVLKANEAISSEVRSEQLFASLMSTVLENAAAQRGSLISVDADTGEPRVELQTGTTSRNDLAQPIPLETAGELCIELVRYVLRTAQPQLVDDAGTHEVFSRDPYVTRHSVKSILCLPLLRQGEVVAILYAENNATTHAFPRARVETLKLIAGQAAISLVNARHYDQLEARVEARTAELAAKNRKVQAMLDELDQGILFIDKDLRIEAEFSQHLPHLLATEQIVGREAMPLLFGNSDTRKDAQASMAMALKCCFGQPKLVVRVNLQHLVRGFTRTNAAGEQSHFEVDWKPIFGGNGKLEKFLVVLRDITLLLQTRAERATLAREAEIVSLILAAGVSEFRGFCESTRVFLRKSRPFSVDFGPSTQSEQPLFFRDLHTAKGNARMLNLSELVDELHGAESLLDPAKSGAKGIQWQSLSEHIFRLDSLLNEYERLGRTRLGDLWTGASLRLEQAIRDIETALDGAEDSASHRAPALTQIRKTVRIANGVPLANLFRETARATPSLAKEAGILEPELELLDGNLLLTSTWASVLRNVLTHALRNSLAHGIESAEERRSQGKRAQGRLTLRAEQFEEDFQVYVSDDGRGLAMRKLRDGRKATAQQLAECVFEPGVTTANSQSKLSGRGVGMHAVRSSVREHGGEVHLFFTGEEENGHRPFQLVIDLPTDAQIQC